VSGLEACTSITALRAVWKDERRRLLRSCFGPDRVTGESFERSLDRQLREIRHRLASNFRPHGLLAFAKEKSSGGHRIICVPTVADRLLQFSVLNQLRPRLPAMGLDNPVAFGLASGVERSVLGARKFACRARNERPWVYKADVHKFFDNVERSILRDAVHRVSRQRSLQPLLCAFLETEIEDGVDRRWRNIVAEAGIQRGRGVRQGMPLSPFYAGVYLRDIDRRLLKMGIAAARYVDDVVAFFHTEVEAKSFHDFLKSALNDIGLRIGDPGEVGSKTVIYSPDEAAHFLGMELCRLPDRPYQLRVAQKDIEGIVERIAACGEAPVLQERKVTLTSMGSYFQSVVRGYVNAYSAAQNRDQLEAAVTRAATHAQARVLRDLFGTRRLQNLAPSEIRFLGVDRDVLLNAAPVKLGAQDDARGAVRYRA